MIGSVLGFLLAAFVIAGVAGFVYTAYRRRWTWTGFTGDSQTGPDSRKTLWDWLQILIVPLALALLAFVLSSAASSRDRAAAERRESADRALAADNRREDALDGYLGEMSGLMLDHALLKSRRGSEVQALARTLTLTTLRRLDGSRRTLVLRFVAEAKLIQGPRPKLNLAGAVLTGVSVEGIRLVRPVLARTDLRGGDFASRLSATPTSQERTSETARSRRLTCRGRRSTAPA